jgi:hypothetical protein
MEASGTPPHTRMKKCELCFTEHESWQAHKFASNSASNGGSVASNKRSADAGSVAAVDGLHHEPETAGPGISGNRRQGVLESPKQRWPRESYNAYQREYMRTYRLKKKNLT